MKTDFDTTDRNRNIVISILGGKQIKETGLEHGITTERARQILHNYCEKKDPEAYEDALQETRKSHWTWKPSLEALRARWFCFVEGSEISLSKM